MALPSLPLLQKNAPYLVKFGNWLSMKAVRPHIVGKKNVLDLGCGYNAEMLAHFADSIGHGTGLDADVDPQLAENPKLDFVLGDICETLPRLAGKKYDLITAINFIEHLADPLPVVKAARELLVSGGGGTMFALAPTWFGKSFLETVHYKLKLTNEHSADVIDEHKMYYSKKDIWLLFVRAGFSPRAIKLGYEKCGLSVTCRASV